MNVQQQFSLQLLFSIYQLTMRQNRKNWSHEEDQVISSLVKKYGTKRWTLISQKMKERFPDQGRSGKQCRERWHNHLSPIISKQPWTEQQIKIVFNTHRKFGNKWTQIAQLLPGRTDNAVKNQFYSTLRKGLRRICKILGTRNSTSRIKKIKPTVLSNLISNFTQIPIDQDENQNQLYDLLFQFSNGEKYEQFKQKEVSQKDRQKMQRLLKKILQSKQFGKKKKPRPNIKQHYISDHKEIAPEINQKQDISQNNKQKKQVQKQDRFNFNVELPDEDQNLDMQQSSISESQLKSFTQNQIANSVRLQRFDPPITLKKQNSLAESLKDEQHILPLHKKCSENQRHQKRHEIDIENNENFFKCFLSKSPNFSSRIQLPTPKIQQHYHGFPFINYQKDDEPEKHLNNLLEQVAAKINSKLENTRLR